MTNSETAPKEYGKLTAEQFKRLVSKLPEVRSHGKEMFEEMQKAPAARIKELLDKDFYWAGVYELSLAEHLVLTLAVMGKLGVLHDAVQSADPQQVVLDWADTEDAYEWHGGEWGFFEKKHLIGLAVATEKTLLSIMVYGRSLSALVQEVREGNDDSLFRAVRVDHSILACPTIADRVAKAELYRDKKFFLRLRNAFKGLSGKHWAAYHDLRYVLTMLRDMGLDNLSDAQLEDLLVDKLKVYPNTYSARKNLRKQYTASKKLSTT